ncbi:MAG: DUF2231 domain-containing protein [Acidobacteriota bacterium]
MDLSHLHPLFVHFPVSLSVTGTALLGAGLAARREEWTRCGLRILLLGGLSAVPAYATGQVARAVLEETSGFERAAEAADLHEDLGLLALALSTALAALAGLQLRRREAPRPLGLLALGVLWAAVVALAAWQGGRLVFLYGLGTALLR